MKKTNFFKLLMVGAVTLSLGLAGCNYASEKDLEDLCKKVDVMQTDINDLKALLAGDFVKDVTKTDDGLRITYGTKAPIDLEMPGGGSIVTIDSNGQIIIDGTATGRYTTDGQGTDGGVTVFYPKKSEDGKNWLLPTGVDEEGEAIYEVGPSTLPGGYVIKDETTGIYTLYIPNAAGEMQEIELPSVDSELNKIDIIGWIAGKGKADEDIARFGDNTLNGEGFVANNVLTEFPVPYAWIPQFDVEDDFERGVNTGDFTKRDPNTWPGGKDQYVPKQVLTTLSAGRMGWLVQVAPSTADISGLKGLVLQNSGTGIPPIVIGTPELVSGIFKRFEPSTRAADNSALYFLPFDHQIHKADGTDITYESAAKYEEEYVEEALYSVVTAAGFRSEYPLFPIEPMQVESFEAAVEAPYTGETAVPWIANRQVQLAVDLPFLTGAYEVVIQTPYTFEFIETVEPIDLVTGEAPDENPANDIPEIDTVIDYYMEMSPEYDNNEYIKAQFDIEFSEDGRTFTVGKHPDVLTLTGFVLRVYKLGIDGKIYIEDVVIYVQRTQYGATIFDNDYLVTDVNLRDNSVTTGWSIQDFFLSQVAQAPLDEMFEVLSDVDFVDANGGKTTLEARWKNITHGPKSYRIASLTIDGKKVDGTEEGYEDSQNEGEYPTLEEWLAMFATAGGHIGFFPEATNNAVPAIDDAGWDGIDLDADNGPTAVKADLYKVRRLIIQPPYAREEEDTPFFDINKEYVIRFEFYDGGNNFMSYADIKFTPVIPALADLFVKEPEYWNGSTLNAYYRTPGSHWPVADGPQWFYDLDTNGAFADEDIPWENTPATPGSTFYNVFVPQAQNVNHTPVTPYDGGYKVFGDSKATDDKWLDAKTHIQFSDYDEEFDDEGYNNQFIEHARVGDYREADDYLGYNTGAIVELYSQTPVEDNDATLYAEPIPMDIHPGKYLAVYDYFDYDDADGNEYEQAIAAALADLEFDLKIMSALEQGKIEAATDGKFSLIGGGTYFLNEDNFKNENYSGAVKYSLFTNAAGRYNYNYIYSVEFFMPTTDQGYPNDEYPNVTFNSDYVFIGADGDAIAGATETDQINPDEDDANEQTKPYIGLEISNTTIGKTSHLGVRVTDRFGKVKEVLIPIEIKVAQ